MREVIVFGLVGILATLTHYLIALLVVKWAGVGVLYANVFAYCVAVVVSFLGHSRLTFRADLDRGRFAKFVAASLSALAVSQSLLFVLTRLAIFDYQVNILAAVFVVPLYSFILNKFWVYRK